MAQGKTLLQRIEALEHKLDGLAQAQDRLRTQGERNRDRLALVLGDDPATPPKLKVFWAEDRLNPEKPKRGRRPKTAPGTIQGTVFEHTNTKTTAE